MAQEYLAAAQLDGVKFSEILATRAILAYLFNDGSHWSGAKTLWARSVGTMHGLAQRNAQFKTVFVGGISGLNW